METFDYLKGATETILAEVRRMRDTTSRQELDSLFIYIVENLVQLRTYKRKAIWEAENGDNT